MFSDGQGLFSESPLGERLDRIITLLEGDKAFAGKVIEQIYVEICEVNRNLYRLILIADPEKKAAWIEDQKRRGASTSATENLIHYPLPGDPEPTVQPEFSPMTPDDQAAVERWRNETGSIGQALLTEFIVWLDERGYCKSLPPTPARLVQVFLEEKDSNA